MPEKSAGMVLVKLSVAEECVEFLHRGVCEGDRIWNGSMISWSQEFSTLSGRYNGVFANSMNSINNKQYAELPLYRVRRIFTPFLMAAFTDHNTKCILQKETL